MVITYSGRSKPSAEKIAAEGGFELSRSSTGLINWGRATANTELNPDISNSTNKRRMRELFKKHNVPTPEYYGPNLSETDLDWKFPVVGRPDQHSKGRGFWLIRDFSDFRKALRGTRRKKAATHFMEYIEAPHEYRVHIFNGKSIRISEKKYHGAEGNHKLYTTIKPTGEIKHVRKAAKQAVAALGLDFGAVDILATNERCWVLEVNAAPGVGGTLPKLYARVFEDWYEERNN